MEWTNQTSMKLLAFYIADGAFYRNENKNTRKYVLYCLSPFLVNDVVAPYILFIMLQDIASVVAVSGQYVTVESYVEAKHDLHIFKIGDFYRAITWVHYPITDREI